MPVVESTQNITVWLNVLLLVSRYVHIIASMMLVGGVLFYEMVVPSAIADLNEQQQMAIFARARLVFRSIAWTSISLLLLSGSYLTFRRMHVYIETEFPYLYGPTFISSAGIHVVPWALKTGVWWAAHCFGALIAMTIAILLVSGNRPPRFPLNWLRLDLIVLLVVVFFACVTHQVEQLHRDRALTQAGGGPFQPQFRFPPSPDTATPDATEPPTPQPAPATQP